MELAVKRQAMAVAKAAETFGPRMKGPLTTFHNSMDLALNIEMEPSSTRTMRMADPLDHLLEDMEETADGLAPADVLYHHIGTLCACSAALGWVVCDDPAGAVAHAISQARPEIQALRAMGHPSHGALADVVDAFLTKLADYVAANHATGLQFADGKGAAVHVHVGSSARATAATAAATTTAAAATTAPAASSSSPSVEPTEGPVTSWMRCLSISDKHTAAHLVAYRQDVMSTSVTAFVRAAASLGGIVEQQSRPAFAALQKIYDFIVKASQMEKPPGDEEKQKMLEPLIADMTAVGMIATDCVPRDVFFNHVKAVEEAMGMVSWIVADSKPTTFVTDADGSASFYLNKVLMTTKKEADASSHKAFVQSLRQIFTDMKAYIKEHHTMGLRYNIGISGESMPATSPVSAKDDDSGDSESTYVTAFSELLDGPLVAYVSAAEALGGDVAEQAKAFAAAWKAEGEFLAKAISMQKPDDIQDMLAPIAAKMGEVGAIVEKMDPRGPLAQHCTAVGESVAALGWVAVDEKATAFVGDMAGAGQFFVDKVKMGAKKTDNPDAHRTWAAALETLYAELKAYVKEYHTQKLVWNPPKLAKRAVRSAARGAVEDESDASDYVSAFKALVDGPVSAYVSASKVLGGDVEKQASAFAGAWVAEGEFLSKAIVTPKPDDIQDMLAPIAAKMGEVGAVVEAMDPRGPLAHHCNAVGESVAALGWVAVDEKATAFVGDMAGAGQFFLDKAKMGARNTANPDAHRAWTKTVETLFADLKAYVKEYHTQKLVWNPPKATSRRTQAKTSANVEEAPGGATDYLTAFKAIIEGPLKAFVSASNTMGGDVAVQAAAFADAWEAEAEFLAKAIAMPKPDDIQDMLAPIATKMGEVGAVVEKMDPRGPLAQHCNAVGESVAALGWVAVDEKATGFVGDMAGAGQFFMDKVKMGARKTDNPDAHRTWATSLETLFAELKAYVKEYHTQTLSWNTA